MGKIARTGILLIAGLIACSANVQSWAEDEKTNQPQKLTGWDAAKALVGNTIVGYIGEASPSANQGHETLVAFYFAQDGAIWEPPEQGSPDFTPKWSVQGDQFCIARDRTPSSSECSQWEVDGVRGTSVTVSGDGHHTKVRMWILPGNAFDFPKGTVVDID
jgi:hypothetical protein